MGVGDSFEFDYDKYGLDKPDSKDGGTYQEGEGADIKIYDKTKALEVSAEEINKQQIECLLEGLENDDSEFSDELKEYLAYNLAYNLEFQSIINCERGSAHCTLYDAPYSTVFDEMNVYLMSQGVSPLQAAGDSLSEDTVSRIKTISPWSLADLQAEGICIPDLDIVDEALEYGRKFHENVDTLSVYDDVLDDHEADDHEELKNNFEDKIESFADSLCDVSSKILDSGILPAGVAKVCGDAFEDVVDNAVDTVKDYVDDKDKDGEIDFDV